MKINNLAGAGTRFVVADASGNLSAGTGIGSGIVTGVGVATRVAFWNTASDLGSNANLYWDNTNSRLGVGIAAPTSRLHVSGSSRFSGDVGIDGGNTLYFGREENFGGGDVGGADYGYIRWDNDNNSYNHWGDSGENGALVIGSQNDGANTVSDVVVLEGVAANIFNPGSGINYFRGRVGIGTPNPVGHLHIAGNHVNGIFTDGNDRPSIGATGHYPQMVMMAGGTGNTSHGATIILGSYDSGTSGAFKHWSIGTSGQNSTFLDIGYSSSDLNPHAGIRNYNGSTFMTITNSGYVGINTTGPGGRLHAVNSGGEYMIYNTSGNLQVYEAESTGGEVRIGAAWNKPGIYTSNSWLYVSSEGGIAINDNNQENWYFDGDNFYSNGWGHIYTSSSNLHLDSYSGEMYLNYYYNNWVNIGDPGSAGYMRVGGFHIYDNNDWAYHTGAPNDRVYFENRVGIKGTLALGGNPWGWGDPGCVGCSDAINGNPNLWLTAQDRIYFQAGNTGAANYNYRFSMNAFGLSDKEVATETSNWGYLGSSGRRWYWFYANNKSSSKPNPFISGSEVLQEDGSQTNTVRNYCTESIKYTIEDWGVGQLVNGEIFIEFYEYTKIWLSPFVNPIVSVTPMGNCNGLYISEITPKGFKVKELSGGTSNVKFSWRLAGIRAGDEVVSSVVDYNLERFSSAQKGLRTENPEKLENRDSLIEYLKIMFPEAKKRGFITALEQLDLTPEGEKLALMLGITGNTMLPENNRK